MALAPDFKSNLGIPPGSISMTLHTEPPKYTKADIEIHHTTIDYKNKSVRLYFTTPQGELAVMYDQSYIAKVGEAQAREDAFHAILEYLNQDIKPFQAKSDSTGAGTPVTAELRKAIPGLADACATCPSGHKNCCYRGMRATVVNLVMHLNDSAKWSREQIADWLESLDADLRFQTPTTEGDDDGNSHQG